MRSASTFLHFAIAVLLSVGGYQTLDAQARAVSGDLTVEAINYDASGRTPVTISVKDNQMRIDQSQKSLIFRVSGPQPGMLMLDHAAKRVDFLPSQVISAGQLTVSAETRALQYETTPEALPRLEQLAPFPTTVAIVRNGIRQVVPVKLSEVGFYYEGDATLPGMDQAAIPADMKQLMKVVMRIDSRARVDASLEGAGTLAALYGEMVKLGASESAAGMMAMTSGLMAINRDIASTGFPLWVGTKTEIRVSVDGPMAGMMERMFSRMPGVGSTLAVSVVESISTDPVDAALFYGGGMPPDYELRVLEAPRAAK
jgi:hypothetical protein